MVIPYTRHPPHTLALISSGVISRLPFSWHRIGPWRRYIHILEELGRKLHLANLHDTLIQIVAWSLPRGRGDSG